MTAKSRTALKQQFATGDVPTGTDFVDLIDSFVSMVDTTAQAITSEVVLGAVSASTGKFVTAVAIGTAAAGGVGLTVQSTDEAAAIKLDTPTTAIASGGGGGATPVSAAGFLIVRINGVQRRIAFYNHK